SRTNESSTPGGLVPRGPDELRAVHASPAVPVSGPGGRGRTHELSIPPRRSRARAVPHARGRRPDGRSLRTAPRGSAAGIATGRLPGRELGPDRGGQRASLGAGPARLAAGGAAPTSVRRLEARRPRHGRHERSRCVGAGQPAPRPPPAG